MRSLGIVLAAVLVLGAVLVITRSNQRTLESRLPDPIVCATQTEAWKKAEALADSSGAIVGAVVNTGSMYPYLPRLTGDPLQRVVAYTVTTRRAFTSTVAGDLCVYRPVAANLIHVAAEADRGGWIMSGLANARSDTKWRMTADNYVGHVEAVFVWRLSE